MEPIEEFSLKTQVLDQNRNWWTPLKQKSPRSKKSEHCNVSTWDTIELGKHQKNHSRRTRRCWRRGNNKGNILLPAKWNVLHVTIVPYIKKDNGTNSSQSSQTLWELFFLSTSSIGIEEGDGSVWWILNDPQVFSKNFDFGQRIYFNILFLVKSE